MAEQKALTAEDRCDRCGAQAYARTTHTVGVLLWCAHHLRMHGEHLLPHLTHDETHLLKTEAKKPEPVK